MTDEERQQYIDDHEETNYEPKEEEHEWVGWTGKDKMMLKGIGISSLPKKDFLY